MCLSSYRKHQNAVRFHVRTPLERASVWGAGSIGFNQTLLGVGIYFPFLKAPSPHYQLRGCIPGDFQNQPCDQRVGS